MSVPYYGDFAEDDTVLIPFNTFSSDDPSASCTITDLVDADLKVHKDGSTDEIATDGATITINFDGVTGNHLVTIDTSADAAYATGSEYAVRMEGTTIDGATVNAWIGAFSIERAGGVLALLKAGTTVQGNCNDALIALNLDHLLKVTTGVAADGDLEDYCVAGTVMAHLLATGADATTFKASTDSLQGIRDHIGDGTNLTEAGGDGDHLTEAGGDGDHLNEAGGDGDHLTAINLPNQTMDITGDITGNLSGSVGSLTGHTVQTGDSFAIVNGAHGLVSIQDDIDEILVDTAELGSAVGASLSADIAAIKSVVDSCSTHNAAAVKTAMEADGGDLSSLMEALVNKAIWTEADGQLEMFNDSDVSQGTIAAQIATDGTYTTRKRAVK